MVHDLVLLPDMASFAVVLVWDLGHVVEEGLDHVPRPVVDHRDSQAEVEDLSLPIFPIQRWRVGLQAVQVVVEKQYCPIEVREGQQLHLIDKLEGEHLEGEEHWFDHQGRHSIDHCVTTEDEL